MNDLKALAFVAIMALIGGIVGGALETWRERITAKHTYGVTTQTMPIVTSTDTTAMPLTFPQLRIEKGSNRILFIDRDNVVTFENALSPRTRICWRGECLELSEVFRAAVDPRP